MSVHQARIPNELSFELFPRLPLEIRLMIWEYTWPAPRVIEAATYNNALDEDADYDEFTILRPGGSYSSFFTHDAFDGWRTLDSSPLEPCPHPVALRVCHESRHHTLKEYTAMQHTKSTLGSFYFSPDRDFLWFCIDFIDEHECLDDLKGYYGSELQNFKRILVFDCDWIEQTPSGYSSVFLAPLGVLEEIRLVYDGHDEDGNRMNTDDDLCKTAAEFKAECERFVKAVETSQGVAKWIRYMDFNGKFY